MKIRCHSLIVWAGLLCLNSAIAETWPLHLTNGTHYTSYGVETYDSNYPTKELYIDPVAILQAGATNMDDIYDDNQVYLNGGTVYASAIDAPDFTWNSGDLHLNGGNHTSIYGSLSFSHRNLYVESTARVALGSYLQVTAGNSLTVSNAGELSTPYLLTGNLDPGTIRVASGGKIYATAGLTLDGDYSTLTVNGNGSLFETTGSVFVGDALANRVLLQNGGTMRCSSLNVSSASNQGSYDEELRNGVILSGDESLLDVAGNLSLYSPESTGDSLSPSSSSRELPSLLVVSNGAAVWIGDTLSIANSSWCWLDNGGRMRIGTVSTSDSALAIATNGTLEIALGEYTSGTSLTIDGDADLDGTLTLSLLNDFVPTNGASFNLFSWGGSVYGQFATTNLPALTGSLEWDTTNLYSTGQIMVIPEPGVATLMAVFGGGLWFMRRLRI